MAGESPDGPTTPTQKKDRSPKRREEEAGGGGRRREGRKEGGDRSALFKTSTQRKRVGKKIPIWSRVALRQSTLSQRDSTDVLRCAHRRPASTRNSSSLASQ
ncbi:unnamed protein product [Prorocentrum cordatum]|uniref:Uncharacterized protein n=1 Tax=Prorocentrum cordatum TaxID=2364126 RepID=A0ABN9PZY1_9DINO|nr:unnamed protein product [Polarella glacialis]